MYVVFTCNYTNSAVKILYCNLLAPGIYSPFEVLDFGVLRSQDEPKVVTLSLLNSGQKHVHVAVCIRY